MVSNLPIWQVAIPEGDEATQLSKADSSFADSLPKSAFNAWSDDSV
jgi:hypothetical protein